MNISIGMAPERELFDFLQPPTISCQKPYISGHQSKIFANHLGRKGSADDRRNHRHNKQEKVPPPNQSRHRTHRFHKSTTNTQNHSSCRSPNKRHQTQNGGTSAAYKRRTFPLGTTARGSRRAAGPQGTGSAGRGATSSLSRPPESVG